MKVVKATITTYIFCVGQCLCMCPPLIAPKGTILVCEDPVHNNQRLDCSSSWLVQGTTARFRCVNKEQKRVKGRITCLDDGVHKLHETYQTKDENRRHLPCSIREDKWNPEMHLYTYDSPVNYELLDNFDDFHLLGLFLHNRFRKNHGSPPLQLLGNLSSYAQEWVSIISKAGRLDLAPYHDFGQNIFLANTSNVMVAVNDAIQNWYYSGLEEYRWDDVTQNWDNLSALPFSQLIWDSSKYLGLGAARIIDSNRTAIVAFYYEPGNVVFDGDNRRSELSFKTNVKPKLTTSI